MSIFQSVIKNITLTIRNLILLIILLINSSHLVANEYNENAMNLIHQDSTIIFKSNSEESHHSIHINGEDVSNIRRRHQILQRNHRDMMRFVIGVRRVRL